MPKEKAARRCSSLAYFSMLRQSWRNPSASSLCHRQKTEGTWRRDCDDILLLLKKHQSGCRRQWLACSDVHNNRTHSRAWTGKGWEVFFVGVSERNEGLTLSRGGKNGHVCTQREHKIKECRGWFYESDLLSQC